MSSLIHYSYKVIKRGYWKLAVWLGREETEEIVREDYVTFFHTDPGTWNRVKESFKNIRHLAQKHDMEVIVLIFPILHKLDRYPWKNVHQQVAQAAQANNLIVLDLLEHYQAYKQHELQVYNGDNIHPNELGHQIAAEALYRLLQQQMVGRSSDSKPIEF